MIGRLQGRLIDLEDDTLILDVSGVGYEVHAPGRVAAGWAERPESVVAWISTQVREDAITLYGFATREERRTFTLLLTVNGVGPKLALAALDTFTPGQLARAVQEADIAALTQISGVGKRTAQRLALELEKKLTLDFEPAPPSAPPLPASKPLEAALQQLGYRRSEIERVLLDPSFRAELPVEEQLKAALRVLYQG